jgi:hypothetical protein
VKIIIDAYPSINSSHGLKAVVEGIPEKISPLRYGFKSDDFLGGK